MKDNIQTTTSTEVAAPDQIEQFKSLYYLLKGKRDTDIKLFKDFKQFRYRDIIELNEKVYKKLRLHELITDTNSVVVSLSNKEIKSFGSWHEFVKFDWNIAATTSYITLEWDFNLILPNQTHNIPQTHNLRVRIGNGLRPNEMIQVIFQGDGETDLDEVQSQVVCKIDFVNSQIASELKTIVSDWYDSLPNNSEDHTIIRFLLKNKMSMQYGIIILFLIAGVVITNYISSYYLNNLPTTNTNALLQTFFLISSSSFIVLYFFYACGMTFSRRVISKRIDRFERNPMFEFTKGDENKLAQTLKDNTSTIYKLLKDLGLAILINILAFGIGHYFPQIAQMIH